jgi:amino acid permease
MLFGREFQANAKTFWKVRLCKTTPWTNHLHVFFYVEVVTYSVFMVILAMVLTSLDVVLDIMSATCAMAVMFILPGLFFLTGERLPQATYRWQMCACAFIVIGTAMAIVSAGDVVSKLS